MFEIFLLINTLTFAIVLMMLKAMYWVTWLTTSTILSPCLSYISCKAFKSSANLHS